VSRALEVIRAGALTTVQDLGRPGLAALGVPRSGALDEQALRLANRLVGNDEGAAGLEITLSGCAVRAGAAMAVAVTGAPADVRVGGRVVDEAMGRVGRAAGRAGDRAGGRGGWRAVEWGIPVAVRAGEVVELGPARAGVRSYLAVGGGVAVPAVLGSRSTDTLSGLGPAVVRDGDVLPVGAAAELPAGVDLAPYPEVGGELVLRVWPGPRREWFTAEAVATLLGAGHSVPGAGSGAGLGAVYRVSATSNRVGVRLGGPGLARAVGGELPSEGLVVGAVQVPSGGEPLVFLADHPTTGGYPVIGVVEPGDLGLLAQARPGTAVRFRGVGRWD
jgi:allophanate hydrolase subunit 2